jgi:hypothetical protein
MLFRLTCHSTGRVYEVAIAVLVGIPATDDRPLYQVGADLDGAITLEIPPLTIQSPPWDLIPSSDGKYYFEIDLTEGMHSAEELND